MAEVIRSAQENEVFIDDPGRHASVKKLPARSCSPLPGNTDSRSSVMWQPGGILDTRCGGPAALWLAV